MLVLNHDAVVEALPMADCIAAVDAALRDFSSGGCEQFPRLQLRPTDGAPLMGLMPVYRGGTEPVWCLKDVLVAPANRARGLDSHQGAILVHDGRTGALRALLDATAVTAIRTAAATAVATRALAVPGARRIAILGSGTQARAHIEAMRVILPEAGIVLWSRAGERARALAEAMGVETAESIPDALSGADVVCTLTAAHEPLIERGWLGRGCHVNAVGSSTPTARELDGETVAAAELFVDSRAQALMECGEILIPMAEGRLDAGHIRAEIGAVLAGRHAGRSSDDALTLFKSLGVAVEDMAAALSAIRAAEANGLGHRVDW